MRPRLRLPSPEAKAGDDADNRPGRTVSGSGANKDFRFPSVPLGVVHGRIVAAAPTPSRRGSRGGDFSGAQSAEPRVERLLLPRVVKRPRHLRSHLTAGSRIGDRESRRDTVRRDDEIAVLRLQLMIEIAGERVHPPCNLEGTLSRRARSGKRACKKRA